jgi:hypothetical protein
MEISLRPILRTSAPLALALAACSTPSSPDVLSYDAFKARAYGDLETDTRAVNGAGPVATEQAMRDTDNAHLDPAAAAGPSGHGDLVSTSLDKPARLRCLRRSRSSCSCRITSG